MKIVVVTGLSGAGKTQAINCLEDLGYYCIDNMPPALIKNFIELTADEASSLEKAALVIDVRGGEFFADAKQSIIDLKNSNNDYTVIFLEASKEVLIRRFNETRRVHPLAESGNPASGIEKEIELLSDIRKLSDVVIDTSNMKSSRLKEEIKEIIESGNSSDNFIVNISSFGYKQGIPLDTDFVFDVRFIPNPFYVSSLRALTGNNKKVQEYVMKFDETKEFIDTVYNMVEKIIPSYVREGKYHVNIAFGCTGGQHRSVTLANVFAEKFKNAGRHITLKHRELD